MASQRPTGGQMRIAQGTRQVVDGLRLIPGYFGRSLQTALAGEIREAVAKSPFFTPEMYRTGQTFSVRMTNLGPLGWVSDKARGYRYQKTHPVSGQAWPRIPAMVLDVWRDLSGYGHPPEACLVNYYAPDARMGLHQDSDEEDFSAPVVSISLGDTCLFRLGGLKRGDPTRSFKLSSGDVLVLGGQARLCYHGVDKIYPGTSGLLRDWFPAGGRINLTLRRVTRPA